MLKVKYEVYFNDYTRSHRTIQFNSLDELTEWIFGQMKRPYDDSQAMFFPTPERFQLPGRISFTPDRRKESYWIHQIESNGGIIFSDGTFTSGQKYWSNSAQKWCSECSARKVAPKFNFVEDEPSVPAGRYQELVEAADTVCGECIFGDPDRCESCPVRKTLDALRKEVK